MTRLTIKEAPLMAQSEAVRVLRAIENDPEPPAVVVAALEATRAALCEMRQAIGEALTDLHDEADGINRALERATKDLEWAAGDMEGRVDDSQVRLGCCINGELGQITVAAQ